MIWLTWRQFRGQLLATVGLLAAVAGYLLYVGITIRRAYNSDILGCVPADGCNVATAKDLFLQSHANFVTMPAVALVALPAVIGVFWGTPLITREFEANTHRLVWNQSVTRTRWLAVKLAVIGLVSVAVTGLLSALLTWAASRYDQLHGNRFDPLSFASRNAAPLGYVAFAFILGTTVGLFLRRTVPAMAVTLLVVAVVQVLVPSLVRPYVRPPVTEAVAFDATTRNRGGTLEIGRDDPVRVLGYAIPGALMLTTDAELVNASGETVYTAAVRDCLTAGIQAPATPTGEPDGLEQCIARHQLHFDVSFQPAARYWSFQWLEFGTFLGLAALLCGLAFWRVRHVRG